MTRYAPIAALLLALAGCSSPPTPFEVGHEVAPPAGCIEYRQRGGQC